MKSCDVCMELLKKLRWCNSVFFSRTRRVHLGVAAEEIVLQMHEPVVTAHWTIETCRDGTRRLVRHWFGNATADVLYLLRLVCRAEVGNHARAMLLHRTQVLPISLQSLHSGDRGTGKVELHANFHSNGQQNTMLESVLESMSLEPAIAAVSWQVLTQEDY